MTARRAENCARLERAYGQIVLDMRRQEPTVEADPGLTCPTFVAGAAWAILEDELNGNPVWSSSELREADASDAIVFLTRWLDASIETLLTGDVERGREHAARFVPLPHELTERRVIRTDPATDEFIHATIGLPDDLNVDDCYWCVREIMRDGTADSNRRIIQELGGTSGLWRTWVGDQFELARNWHGRFQQPVSGWVCPLHPLAEGYGQDAAGGLKGRTRFWRRRK